MAEAVGLSRLYPAVPIMNFISMTLLLLLIPGFWKTRMVALVTLVFWLALGNLVSFIRMVEWRGNTNYAPVWADILAILDSIWFVGFFTSTACFAHFTWQRLQPLAVRQLYDTRRRNNLIHFSLTLILPLLWAPLSIFSCQSRLIMEDYGPVVLVRYDWPGLVVSQLPQIICLLAFGIFNSLAVLNYWRMKREHIEPDPWKQHYSVRTRKLIVMAHFHILLAVYGVYRQLITAHAYIQDGVAPTSLAENIASLQLVLERTRPILESEYLDFLKIETIKKILIPLIGFQLFGWFGFEAEIRKAYQEALSKFGQSINAAFREHGSRLWPLPFSWSLIALRKAKPHHASTDGLSLIDLNVPHITPYISTITRDDDPGSHESISPSNSVGNAIEVKRQARERAGELARRLSLDKPSSAPLHPANAAININIPVPLRWLSHHKPPLPPVNPTASAPEAPGSVPLRVEGASNPGRPELPSSSSPRALHRWYHKPLFVPLGLPTASAMTGPDASGGVAPHVEGPDSARRQEEFALRPPIRRISYHKPTFVPLAPANELGPTVPLVEASRNLISGRNARIQSENISDSGVPPPPFSSLSTSTAPPPFSAPFASMAPPPSFSSPSTPTAPPPPFSSPSTSTAPPPLLVASTPSAPPPLSTPFPPHVGEASITRRSEITALTPSRAPRRSYHKPAFVPLGRPNTSAIATSEVSRSTPLRTEVANNTRRQAKFSPRTRPRRLSYHKPAFVPLAPPANDVSEVANAPGPSIPLLDVPRGLTSDRNARIQAERVSNNGVAPPPFSSPSTSTSTAPPPFSAPFDSMFPPPAFLSPSTPTAHPPLSDVSTPLSSPSTMTPAPPYQDVNPLFDHAT